MKRTIPVTLTLLLLFFASTAIAYRGDGHSNHDGYTSQGDRVNQRLDIKGDRIESHFDQKATRAAEQGKYRLANKFQQKGDQINRHLDRKGNGLHAHFEQRRHKHLVRQHNYWTYKRSASPDRDHHYYKRYNLQRQQPGL